MAKNWQGWLGRWAAATVLAMAQWGLAQAAPVYGYLSSALEPFQDSSNMDAMDAAFGSDWSRLQYGDDYSALKMLYIDGGSENASEMRGFLDTQRGALEDYVRGGGRIFINAATEFQGSFDLLFGARSNEQSMDDRGYSARGVRSSSTLFAGSGTEWDGFFFSHNDISWSGGFESLIRDEQGRTVLAGGFFGAGYVMLGGQTNTSFHAGVGSSDPFQLRVNELIFASNVQRSTPSPVSEPGSLLLAPVALVLVAGLRRRARSARLR